jgi:hypothetical protein
MSGINETTTSVRPFMFGSLNVTGSHLFICRTTSRHLTFPNSLDDDAVPESNPGEGLGTIDLEIWKVEKNDAGPSTWAAMAAPAPKKIHERAKKAVTQQIGFVPTY